MRGGEGEGCDGRAGRGCRCGRYTVCRLVLHGGLRGLIPARLIHRPCARAMPTKARPINPSLRWLTDPRRPLGCRARCSGPACADSGWTGFLKTRQPSLPPGGARTPGSGFGHLPDIVDIRSVARMRRLHGMSRGQRYPCKLCTRGYIAI